VMLYILLLQYTDLSFWKTRWNSCSLNPRCHHSFK
jgi:hypothetical protein